MKNWIKKICLGGVGLACLFFVVNAQNTPWPAPISTNNVGIGTSTPLAKLHVTDDSLVSGGTVLFDADTGVTPVHGAGKRLMWIPSKSAFRVGEVNDTIYYQGQAIDLGYGSDFWDDANIGQYSIAIGLNTKASGLMSYSMGGVSRAEGMGAISLGYNVLAENEHSCVLGSHSDVHNRYGTSVGHHNVVSGDRSTAIGFGNVVYGEKSVSMGTNALSQGDYCVAIGPVRAQTFRSVALGSMNLGLGDSLTSWNPSDPILEIGIGFDSTPKNAFTLYKDGRVQFNELPGSGNYLAINSNGFISRTATTPGTSLWQVDTSMSISYNAGNVNIGDHTLNPGAHLWTDGHLAAHYATFGNPDPNDWFNDESQQIKIGNVLNASVVEWMGTDLQGTSFYGNNGNALLFRFNDLNTSTASNIMTLQHNGNVGIGTETPSRKLHVEGNVLINGSQETNGKMAILADPGPFFSSAHGQLLIQSASATEPQVIRMTNGSTSTLLSSQNGNLSVISENIVIGNSGFNTSFLSNKVSIGSQNTAHPNAKLHVEGDIVCQRTIITQDDWADFVFQEDYWLRPIQEVEQFIEEYGHLPDIPTEHEIATNGLDVGAINVKLLQKIEELTLYVIELNEKMNQLKQ